MTIEYDTRKNRINLDKHHISIPELATILNNPFSQPVTDIPDVKHSKREKRYRAYGWTTTGWYMVIWYCYWGEGIVRIIGGRKLK